MPSELALVALLPRQRPGAHAALSLLLVAGALTAAVLTFSRRDVPSEPSRLADRRLSADQELEDVTVSQALVSNGNVTGRRLEENRYNWVLVEENAGFSARYAHAAVINSKQKMFIMGGAVRDMEAGVAGHTHGYLNDVWVSEDAGKHWDKVTPRSERFTPRRGHAAVVNANGIVVFLMGGFCGKDCFMSDMWSTETGAVWNFLGDSPWSPRHGHSAVITSNDKLVMLGGHNGQNYLNDVWSIQDPSQARAYSTWKCVNKNAQWKERYGHAVVINRVDAIFVLGGFFSDKQSGLIHAFNDVWRSIDDGASWECINPQAPWSGRYQHAAVVGSDNKIFIIGGLDAELQRCNDVWRSGDGGHTWRAVSPFAPWAARYEHAVVMDMKHDTMYVLGGMSTQETKFNDVWRSERTCADDMHCKGGRSVCRDGTAENFIGRPNPLCVDICDRRIFDDCDLKEACRVKNQFTKEKSTAYCIDPCDEQTCHEDEVCEVKARDALNEANPYCLACSDAKTKYACDMLRQCRWAPYDEVCQMRCSVVQHKKKCTELEYCTWSGSKKQCSRSRRLRWQNVSEIDRL